MTDALEQLTAGLAGRYQIERELGAGGMATVYLAHDVKHQRHVAIKVLDSAVAASIGPERFLREIETTAKLRHPHILPLFDSGAIDGVLFYVMPVAEGETLRDRIDPVSRLSLPDALHITREIADALGYAHAHGVVHRDIKPENILLESGHAVVADFGIARVARRAEGGTLTMVGTSVGTPAYMSPEQAAGDLELDGRSDQYSLACVLFEMLTGSPPFSGSTATMVRHHLTSEPPSVTAVRPDVPAFVDDAVRRALSKDPAHRFADMHQFADAVHGSGAGVFAESGQGARRTGGSTPRGARSRRVAIAAPIIVTGAILLSGAGMWWRARLSRAPVGSSARSSGIPDLASDPSIAVLPFVNLSSDKNQEFFSDGMTEELLGLLSKVQGLRVIARTSSFSYKGRDVPVQEIGSTLHVAALLEGSVQRAGSTVRTNVQLVRASDGTQIWAERYDRDFKDILTLQDEIAAAVVKQLKVKLLGAAPTSRPVDPAAYALILRGNFLAAQGTRQSRLQAIDLYKQALKIDSSAVAAWSGQAVAYISQAGNRERPASEGQDLARTAIRSALAIDPNSALPLSLLGWMTMNYDNDFVTAARYFQDALAHDPTGPSIIGNAAMFVQNLGRLDEAIAAMRYQASRDPANPRIPFNLATTYLYAGRWDDAVQSARTVLAMSPGRTTISATMARALLHQGDLAGALAAATAEPSEPARMPPLAMIYHALGRRTEADSVQALLIAKYGKDNPYDVASVLAFRGHADEAFRWLDRALTNGGVSNIAVDPAFTSIRKDPRWIPFLRRAGKAPEQLAAIPFTLTIPK